MATNVDLQLGLSLSIGSVPLSLVASVDKQAEQLVYTFGGCVQDADVPLAEFIHQVAEQFGVDVQIPPELELAAKIDYVAGRVSRTVPTNGAGSTELGIAAKFDLSWHDRKIVFSFYADSILASPSPEGGSPYVVGVAIDTRLPLKDLPLVGKVPSLADLVLTHVGFSYTKAPNGQKFSIPRVESRDNPLFTRQTDAADKNSRVYAIAPAGPSQTLALEKAGFSLTAALASASSGALLKSFALPLALPAAAQQPLPAATTPAAGPGYWIDVDKAFGPVHLQKIGLSYGDGKASFVVSGGLSLGGFSLDLLGLGISFPLPLPGKPLALPTFELQGLALEFQRGSLSIGGAFEKVATNGVTSYYGAVIASAGPFGLKALGGYTPEHSEHGTEAPASFFLYGCMKAPLGGPPFLFVTGLAAGFGIHRELTLPTLDTLHRFVLLPSNAPAQGATPADSIASALPEIEVWLRPKPGQYWLAAGVAFTSFEMIDAFALVTVAFGVELQIALLGTCAMTLPKGGSDALAYIEIDLLASYTQSSGLLAVEGKLSPASYLFGAFCQLTGGFAFYTWVSGERRGDFVVSIGGYHPHFDKPAHYPALPRLGIRYALGPFEVTGQAYFALTPAMLMAGISMRAVWSSGPIRAYFACGLDALVAWAPFHYNMDAYVLIGCAVDLGLFTIDLHAGAELKIWGPDFGGSATVDLTVVSFTIGFGAKEVLPPPLGWLAFKQQLLPKDSTTPPRTLLAARAGRRAAHGEPRKLAHAAAAPSAAGKSNILGASVTQGLLKTGEAGMDWILDPDCFSILTNSTIPSNAAEWLTPSGSVVIPNTLASYNPADTPENSPQLSLAPKAPRFSKTQAWNPDLHIAPMGQEDVTALHCLELRRHSDADQSEIVTAVSIEPSVLDSSAALWAKDKPSKSASDAALVPKALSGFTIRPIPRHPARVNAVPLLDLLFAAGHSTGFGRSQATALSAVGPGLDGVADLLKEEVTFLQHQLPGLEDGRYELTVSQRLLSKALNGGEAKRIDDGSLTRSYRFSVLGERFRLQSPATTISSLFPEDQATGELSTVLPHVVFTRPTLPWSRHPAVSKPKPPSAGKDVVADVPTWLAVLSFDEDDVALFPALDLAPVARTIADLVPQRLLPKERKSSLGASYSYFFGATSTPELDIGDTFDTAVSTLDVPLPLFWQTAPSLADLALLAHVREVSLTQTPTAQTAAPLAEPSGRFSVVFGNRLPQTGKKTHTYLVSLEGLGDLLPQSDGARPIKDFDGSQSLRLAVLASWSFYATGESAAFTDRLLELNGRPPGSSADAARTTLTLPASGADAAEKERCELGFARLEHELRDGTKSAAWYRGPLAPLSLPPGKLKFPVDSAEQLLSRDASTGALDTSYAAAWTIGRQLALQSKDFSLALYGWKKGLAREVVDGVERELLSEVLGQVSADAARPFAVHAKPGSARAQALTRDLLLSLKPRK